MGVPRLFRTLTTKYNDVLTDQMRIPAKHLFFDLNCLIHPVCSKSNEDENLFSSPEGIRKLYQCILDYIQKVISFVNPTAKVYLFMDGVAPLAKIQQQRQRRYKSLYLKRMRIRIEKENGKKNPAESEDDFWDSNIISPETPFMCDLATFLRINLPNCYISGTDEPGEGEHKILEYIFSSAFAQQAYFANGKSSNDILCIYGLDADLIILSWIIQLKRNLTVYLVRETVQMRGQRKLSSSPFTFMNIRRLMDAYYRDLNILQNRTQECLDFVFLCFFLGNDFLPNLFGIQLGTKPDGLYFILESYKHCKKNIENFYLVSDTVLQTKSTGLEREFCSEFINWTNLLYMFETILRQANDINAAFLKWYNEFRPRKADSEERVDLLMHQFENITRKADPVRLTEPGWETRFIKRYFGIPFPTYGLDAHYVAGQYMSGLLWNTKYYFKTENRSSFGYIYPYFASPTLNMLHNFLSIHVNKIESRMKQSVEGFVMWPGFEDLYHLYVLSPLVPTKPLPSSLVLSLILPPESYLKIVARDKESQSDSKTIEQMTDDLLNLPYNADYKHYWNECNLLLEPIEWMKL